MPLESHRVCWATIGANASRQEEEEELLTLMKQIMSYLSEDKIALDEDIAVLERQQLGMASPHARQGRWSDMELGAATFAGWYANAILR